MVVLSCVKLTKKINKDADNYTRASMRYLESISHHEMREDIAAKFLVIEKKISRFLLLNILLVMFPWLYITYRVG